jgi:hypothetical protein
MDPVNPVNMDVFRAPVTPVQYILPLQPAPVAAESVRQPDTQPAPVPQNNSGAPRQDSGTYIDVVG